MKNIPNLVTLLNLVCGFLAIIFILQTNESILMLDSEGYSIVNLPENMVLGATFIFIAAVIDFLDGFIARLMKAQSPMGAQLDSLSDVVSFGVAPGLIMYQLLRMSYAQRADGLDVSILYLLPAVLIPMAGAWRLARFNIDSSQAFGFKGVPIPAAGLVIASLPFILFFRQMGLQNLLLNPWVLYAIIILISWLMISRLPMMALKFKGGLTAQQKLLLAILLLLAAATFFIKWVAVPLGFIVYVLVSLAFNKRNTDDSYGTDKNNASY